MGALHYYTELLSHPRHTFLEVKKRARRPSHVPLRDLIVLDLKHRKYRSVGDVYDTILLSLSQTSILRASIFLTFDFFCALFYFISIQFNFTADLTLVIKKLLRFSHVRGYEHRQRERRHGHHEKLSFWQGLRNSILSSDDPHPLSIGGFSDTTIINRGSPRGTWPSRCPPGIVGYRRWWWW